MKYQVAKDDLGAATDTLFVAFWYKGNHSLKNSINYSVAAGCGAAPCSPL